MLVYKGFRAAAPPEILTKIKLNIWIKVFVRRYVLSLKQYKKNYSKFKYAQQILRTVESEWAVPYPDVACQLSAAGV